MKKLLTLSLMLSFAWLQAYQLGDANLDAFETLQAVSTQLGGHHAVYTVPVAPDDDTDDEIPSIFDGTLQPTHFAFVPPVMPAAVLQTNIRIAEFPILVQSRVYGPSPPGPVFFPVVSNLPLAPPAA